MHKASTSPVLQVGKLGHAMGQATTLVGTLVPPGLAKQYGYSEFRHLSSLDPSTNESLAYLIE